MYYVRGVFSFKRHLGEMRLLRLDQLEGFMCVCENSVNAYLHDNEHQFILQIYHVSGTVIET